jgi:precorrin-6B methylase 1
MTPEPMTERAYILVRNLSALLSAQDAMRHILASGDPAQYGISITEAQRVSAVLSEATQRIFEIVNGSMTEGEA